MRGIDLWHLAKLSEQGIGGVERTIGGLSRAWRARGGNTYCGTDEPGWFERAEAAGRGVAILTHGDHVLNPRELAFLLTVKRAKVWIHVAHGTTVGRMLACREIASLSGYRGILRDAVPALLSTHVIAVSELAKSEVVRYFRVSPSKVSVIANGATLSDFPPLRSLTSERRFGFVGRSGDRVKNTGVLLEALPRSCELILIPGDSGMAKHEQIRSVGPLQGKAIAQALATCRALLLPSLYEGDPLVLHEAKAMGLPIVASDIPQLRAALSGYSNAFFAQPRSPQDWRQALQNLLERTDLNPSPVSRGWEAVAEEYSALLGRLLSHNQS